jgi:GMP synthase-like glutamine amidotransferase
VTPARRILILQHGSLGPPGVLGDWLAARGLDSEVHASWQDPLPDDPERYAAVASLGSQHAATAADPAWVPAEVALLRQAVAAGVPVLGLCFGGQALALALGGTVRPAATPEVGWLPVDTTAPDLIGAGPWLQFHWDVFEPPASAELLATSPAGPAAYRQGPHLGTQFHPEVTPDIVEAWASSIPDELAAIGIGLEDLRAAGARHAPAAREQAFRLFDAWWARASNGA